MVAIHNFLCGDTFFARTNGNRYAVLVATAYEEDILALKAQIAHIDVGWDLYASQVSDMYRTIGIRQGCGYKCSLKCHMCYFLFCSGFSMPKIIANCCSSSARVIGLMPSPWANEILPVSSETTMAMASVFSVTPNAARWRRP